MSAPTSKVPSPGNDTAFGACALARVAASWPPAWAAGSSAARASAPAGAVACVALGATMAAAPAGSRPAPPMTEPATATATTRPTAAPGMTKRFLRNQGRASASSGRSRGTRRPAGESSETRLPSAASRRGCAPAAASNGTSTRTTRLGRGSRATRPWASPDTLTPVPAELARPPDASSVRQPGAKSPSHCVPSQYLRRPSWYGYQPGAMVDIVASLANCTWCRRSPERSLLTIRASVTGRCRFAGNPSRSGRTAHAIVRSADGTSGSATNRDESAVRIGPNRPRRSATLAIVISKRRAGVRRGGPRLARSGRPSTPAREGRQWPTST